MIKIVFVIESLQLAGAEKSLVALLQNLNYSRYEVDLILFKKGPLEKSIPEKVNIIYKTWPEINLADRLSYKFKRIFNLNRRHNAQHFWSVIKSKFNTNPQQYAVAVAFNQGFATYYVDSYITASRKFAWLNTDYTKAGYNIKFDYPVYKNFDAIVAVSPQGKHTLENELSKINKKLAVEVIRDITDKQAIQLESKKNKLCSFSTNTTNIVTVCRLVSYKGLDLAIESCEKLIRKGYAIHWYVVGQGIERASLEKSILKKKLSNYFTLLGATENPYPYIKDCDIYVQPSLFEGLPLTLIEATYLNKPIVTTNFSSVYGAVKDGETGLIAEMNADSIVSKIELLLNNNDLKSKLVYNLSVQEDSRKEETLSQFENLINEPVKIC